jgi:membrane-associated HD superfamily phosphohydrolase
VTGRTHSRITGSIRLIVALYLILSAVLTLADPQRAVLEQGMPMGVMLPVAALSFTLGVFLLTGFMSRVCGLLLACLGGWQIASYGIGVVPVLEGLIGVHLMLRGGGAWAMDIYVQKMQDRARRKSLSSPESW